MKASGELMIKFLKTRSSGAEGTTINLAWNNTSLRITNAKKEQDIIMKKLSHPPTPTTKKTLLDIMNI